MRIERFEELDCWREVRKLTSIVYELTRRPGFSSDFALTNQVRKSSVSVMANIAEGFGRNGKAEFLRFLSIARASANEVQSHLYVAVDLGYISQAQFDSVYAQSNSVMKLIGGLMNYLSNHTHPTPQPPNRPTAQPLR